jgi:GNAT superfamily N-acetyltransferase
VADPTFRRYDAGGARAERDTVAEIHSDAYAQRIASGDPFYSVDAFMQRFDAYTVRLGFDLVIAYIDGEPVGQTWGWALGPTNAWWVGLLEEPEPGFTREDGKRTFGLSEIMVRQAWTGQGIAHALHDELLGARAKPERRYWSTPPTSAPTTPTPGGAGRKSASPTQAGTTLPPSTCY